MRCACIITIIACAESMQPRSSSFHGQSIRVSQLYLGGEEGENTACIKYKII